MSPIAARSAARSVPSTSITVAACSKRVRATGWTASLMTIRGRSGPASRSWPFGEGAVALAGAARRRRRRGATPRRVGTWTIEPSAGGGAPSPLLTRKQVRPAAA
jgi:hypothetical protein